MPISIKSIAPYFISQQLRTYLNTRRYRPQAQFSGSGYQTYLACFLRCVDVDQRGKLWPMQTATSVQNLSAITKTGM